MPIQRPDPDPHGARLKKLEKAWTCSISAGYSLVPPVLMMVAKDPIQEMYPNTLSQVTLLLALAIGSLGTEYYAWGDVLFERAKALLTAFDDVVNIQTVQISLLMISSTCLSLWREAADMNFIDTLIFKTNKDARTLHSCTSAVLFARPTQWVCIRTHILIMCRATSVLKNDGLPFSVFTFSKRRSICCSASNFPPLLTPNP